MWSECGMVPFDLCSVCFSSLPKLLCFHCVAAWGKNPVSCSWHKVTQLVRQSVTDWLLTEWNKGFGSTTALHPKSSPDNTSLPLYFTCIITFSLSLGILSMKHGKIFPLLPLLRLQHRPSRGNNKQMREMGRVPSGSSQVLWQPSINALVPRLRRRRQAWAWLSQSLSRTGKTWEKSPLPVTFIPTLPATYAHPSTSLDRQTEEQRVTFTINHQ